MMRSFLLPTLALGLLASAATAAPDPRSTSTETAGTVMAPSPLLTLKFSPAPSEKHPAPRRERVLLALKAPPL